MSTGVKKLQEEYIFLRKNPVLSSIGGTVRPVQNDFLHWFGSIKGPKNTPYENGTYYFEMKFTNDYPNKGPIDVRMKTPTYHENISNSNGHICVSYSYDVYGIVHAIFILLCYPNPSCSYNATNKQKAQEFNQKYAMKDQEYDWSKCWDQGWTL